MYFRNFPRFRMKYLNSQETGEVYLYKIKK